MSHLYRFIFVYSLICTIFVLESPFDIYFWMCPFFHVYLGCHHQRMDRNNSFVFIKAFASVFSGYNGVFLGQVHGYWRRKVSLMVGRSWLANDLDRYCCNYCWGHRCYMYLWRILRRGTSFPSLPFPLLSVLWRFNKYLLVDHFDVFFNFRKNLNNFKAQNTVLSQFFSLTAFCSKMWALRLRHRIRDQKSIVSTYNLCQHLLCG